MLLAVRMAALQAGMSLSTFAAPVAATALAAATAETEAEEASATEAEEASAAATEVDGASAAEAEDEEAAEGAAAAEAQGASAAKAEEASAAKAEETAAGQEAAEEAVEAEEEASAAGSAALPPLPGPFERPRPARAPFPLSPWRHALPVPPAPPPPTPPPPQFPTLTAAERALLHARVGQKMHPANFERAARGIIRLRGGRGNASRGDVHRIRTLFGESIARARWAQQCAARGFTNPPHPDVWWW